MGAYPGFCLRYNFNQGNYEESNPEPGNVQDDQDQSCQKYRTAQIRVFFYFSDFLLIRQVGKSIFFIEHDKQQHTVSETADKEVCKVKKHFQIIRLIVGKKK